MPKPVFDVCSDITELISHASHHSHSNTQLTMYRHASAKLAIRAVPMSMQSRVAILLTPPHCEQRYCFRACSRRFSHVECCSPCMLASAHRSVLTQLAHASASATHTHHEQSHRSQHSPLTRHHPTSNTTSIHAHRSSHHASAASHRGLM
jgi:hypothetical protein